MDAGTWAAQRCTVLARALDEPLAGTAPVAPRWVCVEHRGAWPGEVAAHPDPAVAAFATHADAAGWRLLLIRRPGRRGDDAGGPMRVFLADTAPLAARTGLLTLAGHSELADLALPAPGEPVPGARVDDPLLLVCTHGRRDRCCALDGRALVTALTAAGEPHVWESSHLGGHRFAPTALVLPTGYAYGRLDVASAIAARKAACPGEVETARCRGRSTWSAAGQVAELAVRAATGLRDADALQVAEAPGGAVVTARDGRRWAVDVAAVSGDGARPASCGLDPAPFTALRAAGVRPLA
jgi:hypothetical protein